MLLTTEETDAITALRKIAEIWPETLWLFSASGELCVMRCDADGTRVLLPNGSVDPNYYLETIDIPNDGGDW